MTVTSHYFTTTMMLIVFVALVSGCSGGSSGPKTYRVEGTVTHNGTPVEGATVSFNSTDSTGGSASARTDASGKYKLMSSFGSEGTTPGTYSVTVSKREGVKTGKKVPATDEDGKDIMVDEMALKDLLPVDYASTAKTPLKNIAVETKNNTIDFDLK